MFHRRTWPESMRPPCVPDKNFLYLSTNDHSLPDHAMIPKDKAETILTEIKQQVQTGNTGTIAFSSQTILWMAESLVEAIEAVETARQEKAAAGRLPASMSRL